MAKTQPVPVIGSLIMSGHCSFPVTNDPFQSHARCERNGGGSRANPNKVFTPCPCSCHYGETYECGGCGRPIREALLWPFDEDGELRYTHVDANGRAVGEECAVSGNKKQEEEVLTLKTCPRCGVEMDADDTNRLCGECTTADEPKDDFSDLGDEEDDEFSAMLAEFDMDE